MVSRALLAVTVHLLPQQARRRYVDELEAEYATLPRRARLGYALSLLGGAPRLRWQLLARLSHGHPGIRCWLGIHPYVRYRPNPEDHRVLALRCTRCGRERDPRQYLPREHRLDDVAWAGAHLTGR